MKKSREHKCDLMIFLLSIAAIMKTHTTLFYCCCYFGFALMLVLTLLCLVIDVEQGIRSLTNIFDAKTARKRSKT